MSDRDCQHGQLTRVCDRCADAAEIERLRALCEEIAEIAHNGGLVGMSESDAIRAIRKITLPYWRQSE